MLSSLKRGINGLVVKWKYKKKCVCIDRGVSVICRDTFFEGYNKIGINSIFHGTMGYGSYIGRSADVHATIGKYCCISDRVHIVSGKHPTDTFVSIHPAFYSTRKQSGFSYVDESCFDEVSKNPEDGKTPVYIGNDVWIGCDVTILGGIKIGNGAIIAAGAVVDKDVEPYSIVGGVPAKEIRKRFNDSQIDFLQDFKWWDKETSWIESNSVYFQDIEVFMSRYKI